MPPILSCTGVSKSFVRSVVPESFLQDKLLRRGKNKMIRIEALSAINFEIGRGEWVGIYGPNGCGKTTLLRILAGLMEADVGQVRVNGNMSCFFDLSVGFHDERNAIENLLFHGLLQGIPAQQIRAHTDAVIRFAGLESHKFLPLKCYSVGMKLRLGFAAATQTEADLYLLDEVLAVGDAAFQAQCKAKLRSMKRSGSSGLVVSHGITDLLELCDRVLFMEGGKITEEKCVTPLLVPVIA